MSVPPQSFGPQARQLRARSPTRPGRCGRHPGVCQRAGWGGELYPSSRDTEQVRRYRLPTAPPKSTDWRAFHGQTCQAEGGLARPDVLARILQHAIEERVDRRVLERVSKGERAERRKLVRLLRATP